jgi:hypothetical protein
VLDWTSSLVQDWIFSYHAAHIDLYFIFPDFDKRAKCNATTASNNLQDLVHHYVKDHKAFKLKVKEITLEEKSVK